jgi:hypothetical protein
VWAREEATRAKFIAMGLTEKSPLVQFKWTSLCQALAFQGAHESEFVRAAAALKFDLPPVFDSECKLMRASLLCMEPFINAVQGDGVRLCDAYPHYLRLQADLMALGDGIPALLSECLGARFTNTACGGLVKLSYLLTPRGLAFFQGRYTGVIDDRRTETGEVAPGSDVAAAIEERDALITEMVNFQIENGKARIEPAQAGILAWLNTDPVSFFQGKDPVDKWREERLRATIARSPFTPRFCECALMLTSMPCSEAAAERVFSSARWILTKQRLKMAPDLVRALMIVRSNSIYGLYKDIFPEELLA